jgi:uncharacterized protein YjiS (DUF1127 family)
MAHYATTDSQGVAGRTLATFGHIMERAAARLAHHRVYTTTLNELRTLNDRDLADLGLSRSMLRQVARDAADRKVAL